MIDATTADHIGEPPIHPIMDEPDIEEPSKYDYNEDDENKGMLLSVVAFDVYLDMSLLLLFVSFFFFSAFSLSFPPSITSFFPLCTCFIIFISPLFLHSSSPYSHTLPASSSLTLCRLWMWRCSSRLLGRQEFLFRHHCRCLCARFSSLEWFSDELLLQR